MIKYERLDIEKILQKYNVRNISKRGDEIQFSCPFPEHAHGDRNPSSSINTENGKYNCFSCGRKGTLVNFIADIEGVSWTVANRWMEDSYGEEINKDNTLKKLIQSLTREKKPERKKEVVISDKHIAAFSVDWDKAYEAYKEKRLPKKLAFPFKRHFRPETLHCFQIGYDTRTDRITIPIKNLAGELVGFKGRASSSTDLPRYKALGDKRGSRYGFPTCKVHKYVWGLNSADPDVIIVEGEFDAIWLRQNGWKGAIAIGGSNPSSEQITAIKSFCQSALLLLDPDEAGRKAERQLVRSLLGYVPVRIARLVDSDPNETEPQELKQIITSAESALIQKIKQKTHS